MPPQESRKRSRLQADHQTVAPPAPGTPDSGYRRPPRHFSSVDRRSRVFQMNRQSENQAGGLQNSLGCTSSTSVSPLGAMVTSRTTIEHAEEEMHPHIKIHNLGKPEIACQYCAALFWQGEALVNEPRANLPTYPVCCRRGRIRLPLLRPTPSYLDSLLDVNGGQESKNFRKHARSYNAAFSFTSFGAKINDTVMRSPGPYSLILCGENIHKMGSLLPPPGEPPKYAQLYVFDPSGEAEQRLANFSGPNRQLLPAIVHGLQEMLDRTNVLVQSFRQIRGLLGDPTNHNLRLRIVAKRVPGDSRYELPSGTELAGLIPDDFQPDSKERDIIVSCRQSGLRRISHLHPKFDALHFPLLFPHGDDGYHVGIDYHTSAARPLGKRKHVTRQQFYCYRLQYRLLEGTTLARGGKMLQHYCIDAFTTIEQDRLWFIRENQKELRSDLYKGLKDAFESGDTNAAQRGHVILPSTFTGGPRYMKQLYLDAMALCQHFGNPDLFLTFTCNAQWPEIVESFSDIAGEHSEDKPAIVARVFHMKVKALKADLKKGTYFGRTVADIHTIEFQKRGLPHVHILIWLSQEFKFITVDQVDAAISAELPDRETDPQGFSAVTRFMVHGPCGLDRPTSPCMDGGSCKKLFPKSFIPETTFSEDGFALYRRRDTGAMVDRFGVMLDNRYVVPYNRALLIKYQAHLNVELCHKGRLIKYLFKYITKGPDYSSVLADSVQGQPSTSQCEPIDEVSQFLDCRSVSCYEAMWHLFEFQIHERYPSVTRLAVHLPDQQAVAFRREESLSTIISRKNAGCTTLTEWFKLNQRSESARNYTYGEIPNHFTWDKELCDWHPRKRGFSVGRIIYVNPRMEECFYLRILLTKVKGPLSYECLRTVDGVMYDSFKEACQMLGLLSTDDEWDNVMEEVSRWGQPSIVRNVFANLLVFCQIGNPLALLDKWIDAMSDDFSYRIRHMRLTGEVQPLQARVRNQVLQSLQALLSAYSTDLSHFNLPLPDQSFFTGVSESYLHPFLDYDQDEQTEAATRSRATLNTAQLAAYTSVMANVDSNNGGFYFLYGHGGTGKTYLYNTILSEVRGRGLIALVVASSGIAATLLPDATTAHSRFKIPLEVHHTSTCTVRKGTQAAEIIRAATLIIWDEAPMVHRLSFEAVDRTLCDIMDVPLSGPGYKPFGGKIVLLGGDFRQTLPVITEGSRGDCVNASLTRSTLWRHCRLLRLNANMRIDNTTPNSVPVWRHYTFPDWVLAVGDGTLPLTSNPRNGGHGRIQIPARFLVDPGEDAINSIFSVVYNDFDSSYMFVDYLQSRAIVAPTNKLVSAINDRIMSLVPSAPKTYFSFDTLVRDGTSSVDTDTAYPVEFLNTLSFNGVPEHAITLKEQTPIMILRNINPAIGLCNGTRVLITALSQYVIKGVIIGGSHQGTLVGIPRIVLDVQKHRWPFILRRRQFPVRTCYAMTINKSQGQTLDVVGLYLPKPVFTHGQLYVAVSRVRSVDGLHILLGNDRHAAQDETENIVYSEVFEDLL